MSDVTDQVDFRRKKMIEYNAALADFKLELQEQNSKKKDRIQNLARILEEAGYDKEKISSQVTHDLKGQVDSSWVRKILGDEYKEKKFANVDREGVINPASTESEEQKKQPLLVTNNGETEHSDQKAESALDEIYGGKSFSQMKKEADREIDEEMEDTLENPHNGPQIHDSPPVTPMPLLSNISPEYRELQARLDEAQDMIRQMAEDRDTALSQAKQAVKQFNQLKGGSMSEELRRLKVENNNLRTLLADVDKTSLEKEGYKEIEVLKLNQDTTRMIQEVSGKSQRTFFLLVHPKTMQIKAAKTDVQMHIVQARRNAGLE